MRNQKSEYYANMIVVIARLASHLEAYIVKIIDHTAICTHDLAKH